MTAPTTRSVGRGADHFTAFSRVPRGPAQTPAGKGRLESRKVAECACARRDPHWRTALVSASPALAPEKKTKKTRSLRKRCERQLCPATLALTLVTISRALLSSVLGASATVYAFPQTVQGSSSPCCVPLSVDGRLNGVPATLRGRVRLLPWECFGARSSLPPRLNLGPWPAPRAPSKAPN